MSAEPESVTTISSAWLLTDQSIHLQLYTLKPWAHWRLAKNAETATVASVGRA